MKKKDRRRLKELLGSVPMHDMHDFNELLARSQMPSTNALILDREAITALTALRKYARMHIIPHQQMVMRRHLYELDPGGVRAVGDTQYVKIKVGYRVAYSIEEGAPRCPCHHLSMSGPNQLPHPDAVRVIMKIFGFEAPLEDCMVFTEIIGPNPGAIPTGEFAERAAINVILPLTGKMQDLYDATPDDKETLH